MPDIYRWRTKLSMVMILYNAEYSVGAAYTSAFNIDRMNEHGTSTYIVYSVWLVHEEV